MKYSRFYLEKRKPKMGDKRVEWPVVMSFSYSGKKFHRTIGIRVPELNWDSKKQRLKPNAPRASELNRYIDLLEEKADKIYSKALADGIPLDNKSFTDQLMAKDKKEPERKVASLFEEWEKFIQLQKVRVGNEAVKYNKAARNHFLRFCKSRGLNEVKFEDFTAEMKAEFAEYLYELGDYDNTVHSVLKRMTGFLNHAAKIGLHSNHTHKAFHISARVGTIKFLEWHEVKKLIDLEVEPGIESDARDLFVFSCLTGLRYSDTQNLKKLNIKEHSFKELEGTQYAAHMRQQKTARSVVIPLLPAAMDILNRYKNEKSEFALPRRANQTVNRIIKQIGRRAKLNDMVELFRYRKGVCESSHVEKWRILSTHMGRRTFSTIAATSGIPINLACSITGHDPKTMLTHYAGVIDSRKFEEMASKMRF
jgi:integrase